jgi:hypothetical protein
MSKPTDVGNDAEWSELYSTYAEIGDLPVIDLCLLTYGLVVNSAPTRQSGLLLGPEFPMITHLSARTLRPVLGQS